MKIEKYFTTYSITAGFLIASLGSIFIYLEWLIAPNSPIETISAILFFYLLIQAEKVVWFWSGFFISFLWFWWILMSFIHYDMVWAIPLGLLFISSVYGFIFWTITKIAEVLSSLLPTPYSLLPLIIKAAGLLLLSYIHPLSFDWFKPELLFVHSYIGIYKWQLALVLIAIVLAQYKKNILYLFLILLAYSPNNTAVSLENTNSPIALSNMMTTVEDKWNRKLIPRHITEVYDIINRAISEQKEIVILPESVFPFFLNKERKIFDSLLEQSKHITIIIGALYLDGKIHRNSTYIMHNGNYKIANKVLLVPFGESNPLPEWASKWVNQIFFDGAVDYIASAEPTDFEINGTKYRNAICYEATSDKLYFDNPKNMIVTSNNGWFNPSIEPSLQKLLLEFYSRKHGTTIYHSVNMSPSYKIEQVK